ncbi:MAG: DUF2147 domain-containing protein [Alphaproteobacteria bacterium]
MRQKLKALFDAAGKKSKQMMVGATAFIAFGFTPASRAFAQETPESAKPEATTITLPINDKPVKIDEGVTYWKHKEYDMVVKVQPDADKGLIATIYSINTEDANNKYLMAQLKGYGKKVQNPYGGGRGAPSYRIVPDPDAVEKWELEAYCGFQPNIQLKKQKDGSYSGTIVSPFNGGTYGLDIKQLSDGQVKVYGYLTGFPLIKLSEKANRVTSPPPEQCKFSWPDP